MENLIPNDVSILLYPRIIIAAFLAILFIQSGLDKVFNFRENVSWLYTHFANTFLSSFVPFMFIVVTITEVAAGFLSAFGVLYLIFREMSVVAYYGALFSAISLLFLFFGQRIAKDYAGAGSLVPYFILSTIAMLLLY
ncbi:MAG: DoxX family protein [Flavobacteriales bacterium]